MCVYMQQLLRRRPEQYLARLLLYKEPPCQNKEYKNILQEVRCLQVECIVLEAWALCKRQVCHTLSCNCTSISMFSVWVLFCQRS